MELSLGSESRGPCLDVRSLRGLMDDEEGAQWAAGEPGGKSGLEASPRWPSPKTAPLSGLQL